MAFLRGTLRFVADKPVASEERDYGPFVLKLTALEPAAALGLVEAGLSGKGSGEFGFSFEGDHRARAHAHWAEGLPMSATSERNSEWPASIYTLERQSGGYRDPSGPVSTPGLPVVINPDATIDAWLGVRQRGYMAPNNGLTIFVPDYRACIRRIAFGDAEATVVVDTLAAQKSSLLPRAAIRTHAGDERDLEVVETDRGFAVPLERSPRGFYFFVHDRASGQVIDWADVALSGADLPSIVEFARPGRQVAYLIAQGESEKVEFKAKLEHHGPLIQSVAAFANTDGGTILVGVADDGSVPGVSDADRIKQQVQEWIEVRCEPPVPVKFTDATLLGGHKIIMVEVPKGENPPYIRREDGAIFVRRGATDRRAQRTELDEIYERNRKPAEHRLPWG